MLCPLCSEQGAYPAGYPLEGVGKELQDKRMNLDRA